MKLSKIISLWLPVLVWEALIFYLSGIPGLELTHEPVANFISRKSAHLAEYAILFILFKRALKGRVWVAFTLTLLSAVSDELHQSFVPLRTAKVSDLAFDGVGAYLGIILAPYFENVKNKFRKRHS